MSQTTARDLLRSDVDMVLVEAPAGTGKTHEAVSLALDVGALLAPHEEVLLLAHTNAAVNEFRSRARREHARVRTTTFDAFATEIIGPYAPVLGLPYPLRPQPDGSHIPGGTPFNVLAPKLVELMERAPVVARCLAAHHPWIICDEHQDAKRAQHRIADLLRAAGARVRLFADEMQAIFGFDDDLVPWTDLRSAITTDELDEPHRWREAPELGAWILQARSALRDGGALPRPLPSNVTIEIVGDLKDQANVHRRVPIPELGGPLRAGVSGKTGTIAILTSYRQHRVGLRAQVVGFEVHEGSDMAAAQEAIYAAQEAEGRPQQLVEIALELLAVTCTGIPEPMRAQIRRACGPTAITIGKGTKVLPFLERFEGVYTDPSLTTWCRTVGGFLRPPHGTKVVMSGSLRAISYLSVGTPSYERFLRQTSDTRGTQEVPMRGVYTIHASKGREFDHVVIAPCGAAQFPDEAAARRRLYVALSRARRSIHIIAPGDHPSPLLGPVAQPLLLNRERPVT